MCSIDSLAFNRIGTNIFIRRYATFFSVDPSYSSNIFVYCLVRVRPCLDNDGSRCSLCFIITKNWHLKRPYAFVTTRLLVLHMGITNQTLTFLRSSKWEQSVFLHLRTLNILWLVNHVDWLLMLAISRFYFNTGNKLKFCIFATLKDNILKLEVIVQVLSDFNSGGVRKEYGKILRFIFSR